MEYSYELPFLLSDFTTSRTYPPGHMSHAPSRPRAQDLRYHIVHRTSSVLVASTQEIYIIKSQCRSAKSRLNSLYFLRNQMMSQTEFKDFARKIVAETIPDELPEFDLVAESMVEELYSPQEKIVEDSRGSAEFQLGGGAAGVLEFVGLLSGSFTAMLTVVKLAKDVFKRQPTIEEVKKEWELRLLKAGVRPKTVDSILAGYDQELATRLGASK